MLHILFLTDIHLEQTWKTEEKYAEEYINDSDPEDCKGSEDETDNEEEGVASLISKLPSCTDTEERAENPDDFCANTDFENIPKKSCKKLSQTAKKKDPIISTIRRKKATTKKNPKKVLTISQKKASTKKDTKKVLTISPKKATSKKEVSSIARKRKFAVDRVQNNTFKQNKITEENSENNTITDLPKSSLGRTLKKSWYLKDYEK